MTTWADQTRFQPAAPALPDGLLVAGTGVRFGAWLLDGFFVGIVSSVFSSVFSAFGWWSINREWAQQTQHYPRVLPTVPILQVDMAPLIAYTLLTLVATVAFYSFCWVRFRASPAQKVLSLQVADAATGRNLSVGRAVARALVLYGVVGAAGIVIGIQALNMLSTFVPADFARGATDPVSTAHRSAIAAQLAAVIIGSVFAVAWYLMLLFSTAGSRARQGLHDKLAGSLVVGKTPEVRPWLVSPYGGGPAGSAGAPGDPTAAYPVGPWQGYAPAWPQQPAWPQPQPWPQPQQPAWPQPQQPAWPQPPAPGEPLRGQTPPAETPQSR